METEKIFKSELEALDYAVKESDNQADEMFNEFDDIDDILDDCRVKFRNNDEELYTFKNSKELLNDLKYVHERLEFYVDNHSSLIKELERRFGVRCQRKNIYKDIKDKDGSFEYLFVLTWKLIESATLSLKLIDNFKKSKQFDPLEVNLYIVELTMGFEAIYNATLNMMSIAKTLYSLVREQLI